MKVIGVIGGVSWESSSEYCRLINQAVKSKLGAMHSAELVMWSLDFEPIARLEHDEQWDQLARVVIAAAQKLEVAGASFVLIASNTLHKVAPQVQAELSIPLVHIADAVAEAVNRAGISSVGLLGTRFVMEQDFYGQRLAAHGLEIMVPPKEARDFIHSVIYNELALGEIRETSRRGVLEIMNALEKAGATGVVLANTELPLLIRSEDARTIVFDSMAIHVDKAVSLAFAAETV
jgi:aspartate racemase